MAMNVLATLSLQQLRRAVAIKEQVATLESELDHIFGTPAPAAPMAKPGRKTKMSAPARATIPGNLITRGTTPAKTAGKKVKRKVSAKARAKLAASAKARWAKVKAAGKKSLGA